MQISARNKNTRSQNNIVLGYSSMKKKDMNPLSFKYYNTVLPEM